MNDSRKGKDATKTDFDFFASLRLCVSHSFSESIDHPFDAVLDEIHVEVNQHSESFVGEPKVGQKLLRVNRRDLVYGLQFDDHFVFDNEISDQRFIDNDVIVNNWHQDLSNDAQPTLLEFLHQHLLIDGLQESRSEGYMDLERRIDYDATDLVLGHRLSSFASLRLCVRSSNVSFPIPYARQSS